MYSREEEKNLLHYYKNPLQIPIHTGFEGVVSFLFKNWVLLHLSNSTSHIRKNS